ncbi:hypothetical protein E3U47_23900 [Pseudomonas sp. RIT623]|nr:hypothetical protein E3U47_23900 [Pseudomonas sp. RIT623]
MDAGGAGGTAAQPVGASLLANPPTQWMAPALPVFAGKPAPARLRRTPPRKRAMTERWRLRSPARLAPPRAGNVRRPGAPAPGACPRRWQRS